MIRKISCLTISFIILLIFIRAETYGAGYSFILQGPSIIKRVILISVEDIALAVATGGFVAIVSFAVRKSLKASLLVYRTYVALLFVGLSWSVINIVAVRILNTPVNYQLLYYSNLGQSQFVLDLMKGSIFLLLIAVVVALSIGLLLLARLIEIATGRLGGTPGLKIMILVVAGGALLGYFVVAQRYVQQIRIKNHDDYGKVANPAIAFASSFKPRYKSESNMLADLPADSLNKYRNEFEKNKAGYVQAAPSNPDIKNVIFFVMESVAAEYVAGYGGTYDVTPHIKRHLSESVVFTDVYSHSPNSVNALFSMLGPSYPELTFNNIVYERPDLKWPTLSSELKKQNYRTAFYGFSDVSYMGADQFLAHRKFDQIMDHKSMPCHTASFQSDADGAEIGKDEVCMVHNFLDWVSQDSQQRPFFATLWTMQTHWPYFTSGTEKNFAPNDRKLNKYLNALHHSDAALGILLDSLKQKGLAASTLVVVVGDHGEAFGRHGQYGHGSNVYEENVRVPLIFINPLLFSGQKKTVVAGLIDLPVTIMDVLRYPVPQQWQGTSLYDDSRANMAYFFSTWSDYLYGYRKDNYKAVFNVYTNTTAIYDLEQDPHETTNLASEMPELVKSSNNQLAHWVQYNRALLNETKGNVVSAASK